jgi:hypothetical protein
LASTPAYLIGWLVHEDAGDDAFSRQPPQLVLERRVQIVKPLEGVPHVLDAQL